MSDTEGEAPKPKKKGRKKLLVLLLGGLLLGGGAAGGAYVMGFGFGHAGASEPDLPKLVARKGVTLTDADAPRGDTVPDPSKYQASYYPLDQPFTANLRDTDGFAQVALGVSTFYDARVLDNFKDNEMPIRSAILEVLADQDGFVISTPEGKALLRRQLKQAVNGVLKQRTGFGGIDDVYFTSFVIQ